MRASWHDVQSGQERSVVVGTPNADAADPGAPPSEDGADGEKRLKDLYASEDAARRAASAELARIQRGAATLELTLAAGRPQLMPQSPARVTGFKPKIDAAQWLVVSVTHAIAEGSGYTTRVELERAA